MPRQSEQVAPGRIRPDHLHGTLDALVLKTLSWGARHGYAIARWLEQQTEDALRIEEGSLYPALYDSRSAAGSRPSGDVRARPARKFYRLTPRGRVELRREATNGCASRRGVARPAGGGVRRAVERDRPIPGPRPILGPSVPEEVEEELDFHLAMRIRDLVAAGMSEEEARVEALRRFGDLSAVRVACRRLGEERERGRRRIELLGELRQDLTFAWRQLRRSPGFTAVATVTLALGIGATTAVFGVVDAVLLRPLPFPAAQRLVVPESHRPATGETWNVTYADYVDWRQAGVFADVAVYRQINVNVGGEQPERLQAVQATEGFLSTLGVRPVLGRRLRPEEHVAGSPTPGADLAPLWQTRSAAIAGSVGRTLRVTGVPVEGRGVVPQGLDFLPGTDLWFPLKIFPGEEADYARRSNFVLLGIARLRPDRTLEQTTAELGALAERVAREDRAEREGITVIATPLARWTVGRTLPRALWLLLGASALVMSSCVNVTTCYWRGRRRGGASRGAGGAGAGGRAAAAAASRAPVARRRGGRSACWSPRAGTRCWSCTQQTSALDLSSSTCRASLRAVVALSPRPLRLAPALRGAARAAADARR